MNARRKRGANCDVATMLVKKPNTMAPQSALCICSRKWSAKLIVPIYFGTETSKFCFTIISLSSLESELSFDSKDSGINFNRTRSTTVNSLSQCKEL